MNKYLIEILKLRTSVTLPGFGALMIANSRTGKIVLNQLLKYDDKVLAKFIAEKENIEVQEAQNMVSKFIKEIDLEISKGETYDIFQFGKLSKTENGSIVFEMDDSMKKGESSSVNSTSKPETKVEKPIISIPKAEENSAVEKKVIATKVEEKASEKSEPILPKVEQKKEEKKSKEIPKNVYTPPVKPKIEVKVEEKKEIPKPELKAKKEEVSSKEEVVKSKVIVVKTEPEPKKLSAKEKAKQEKEANKKWQNTKLGDEEEKKKRKVWPWILLIIIAIIGIGSFMFQDKLKTILNKSEEKEHIEEVEVKDVTPMAEEEEVVADVEDTLNMESNESEETLVEEENSMNNETVEEIVEPEPIAIIESSVNGSYHIIGGAFGEKDNASAFAAKTGGTVIGRFNGMYQVAVKSYNTRSEVNSAFNSVSSEYSGAWIFKYPK